MQERLRKIERKLVKIGKYIEDFPPGRLIYSKTGINTMTAEDPMKVVAIGTGQFVEFMSGK